MKKKTSYFRLSVTSKCTFSCYFCHNEGQGCHNSDTSELSMEDFIWVCQQMKSYGFEKFKITGGEPTIRKDLPVLIDGLIKSDIKDVSIITNGTLLNKVLPRLKSSGLPRLNVSLYTLNEQKLYKNNGGKKKQLENVVSGIDLAISLGYSTMKINYVFHGRKDMKDLKKIISFVRERNLILVILPLIPISIRGEDEITSLEQMYEILLEFGISSEREHIDGEGISRKLIRLNCGANILLRNEELSDKAPYDFCYGCENRSDCREGIFPIRMSANGDVIPCLAGGIKHIPTAKIIHDRDGDKFRKIITSILE